MKSINAALLAGLSITVGMTGFGTKARALDLYTGEKTGAYFNEFCPTIKKAAKEKLAAKRSYKIAKQIYVTHLRQHVTHDSFK